LPSVLCCVAGSLLAMPAPALGQTQLPRPMGDYEHTFDGGTLVFPDGRIVTQCDWDKDSKRTPQERAAFHAARHRVGAEDNRFVLDQLERANTVGLPGMPAGLRGRMDTQRVGALGHSLGGMISVVSGQEDKRFRICLNLDGGL